MSNPTPVTTQRLLSWPGQLFAWYLIVLPVIGVMVAYQVPGPEGAMGRVRLLGLISDALYFPLLGILLGAFLASYFGQRALRFTYAVLSGFGGLLLLVLLPILMLDVLQVRGRVSEEMRPLYQMNAVRSALVLLWAVVILVLLAVMLWRGLRREATQRPVTDSRASRLVRPTTASTGDVS